MDYTEKLKTFPMLENIPREDLAALSALLREERFPAGKDIQSEGAEGNEMYLLTEGSVDVIKATVFGDSFVVTTLDDRSHSVFGEMALIDPDRRSSTVRAKTDCRTLVINRESFDRFCEEHPRCGVRMLRMISIHLVRNIRRENENLKQVYQALIEEIDAG